MPRGGSVVWHPKYIWNYQKLGQVIRALIMLSSVLYTLCWPSKEGHDRVGESAPPFQSSTQGGPPIQLRPRSATDSMRTPANFANLPIVCPLRKGSFTWREHRRHHLTRNGALLPMRQQARAWGFSPKKPSSSFRIEPVDYRHGFSAWDNLGSKVTGIKHFFRVSWPGKASRDTRGFSV